jgi:hypothetical protein
MLTPGSREVLLHEHRELNNWSRHILHLYYSWFTVFLSATVLAQAWIFQYDRGKRSSIEAKAVFMSFILADLLGIFAAWRLNKYVRESSARLDVINQALSDDESFPKPKSSIPLRSTRVGFIACSIGLMGFLAVWLMLLFMPGLRPEKMSLSILGPAQSRVQML